MMPVARLAHEIPAVHIIHHELERALDLEINGFGVCRSQQQTGRQHQHCKFFHTVTLSFPNFFFLQSHVFPAELLRRNGLVPGAPRLFLPQTTATLRRKCHSIRLVSQPTCELCYMLSYVAVFLPQSVAIATFWEKSPFSRRLSRGLCAPKQRSARLRARLFVKKPSICSLRYSVTPEEGIPLRQSLSVSPVKKMKREAAQRRPARSERKTAFFRETTGRMV